MHSNNVAMKDIIVPPGLLQEIAESEAEFCRKVRNCDPLEGANNIASGYKSSFAAIENVLGKDKLKTAKVLEIGSGNGFLLCYAVKNGIDIVGIEPGKTYGFHDRNMRAIKLLKANGVLNSEKVLYDASAEALPFKDDSFDFVYSVAVLEHVRNVELAMKESIRVLKPGGLLWANIPNYNSLYEGHYDILWLPYMSKNMAKCYVSLLYKRDPYYVDELIFTNPSMFKKYLKSGSTYGKLLLRGRGLANYVFEISNICSEKDATRNSAKYSGAKRYLQMLLEFRVIKLILKYPFMLFSEILGLAGLAATFDIVLHKRETGAF